MPSVTKYHHGKLKETLIKLCLQRIEQSPDEEISIRSLARDAGVSPNAPYRHFKDRDSLLSACAEVGSRELAGQIRAIEIEGNGKRYREAANRYVTFARERPGLYRLMVDPSKNRTALGEELIATISEIVRVYIGEVVVNERVAEAVYAFVCLCDGACRLPADILGMSISEEKLAPGDLARMLGKGIRA